MRSYQFDRENIHARLLEMATLKERLDAACEGGSHQSEPPAPPASLATTWLTPGTLLIQSKMHR